MFISNPSINSRPPLFPLRKASPEGPPRVHPCIRTPYSPWIPLNPSLPFTFTPSPPPFPLTPPLLKCVRKMDKNTRDKLQPFTLHLHSTPLYSSILLYTPLHSSTLFYSSLHSSLLIYTPLHSSTLLYTPLYCFHSSCKGFSEVL